MFYTYIFVGWWECLLNKLTPMLDLVYQQKQSYNSSPPTGGTVSHLRLWLKRTRTITLSSFSPIFLMVETQLGRRSGTVSLVAGTDILLHHSRLVYRVAGERICIKIRVVIQDLVDGLGSIGGPHHICMLCKGTGIFVTKGVEGTTYLRPTSYSRIRWGREETSPDQQGRGPT